LEQNKNSAPRQIQAAMISAMQTFKDDQPLNDDITLYCCQVKA
jgi:serine phosphatase RsbU (regulator of sigma subunit)